MAPLVGALVASAFWAVFALALALVHLLHLHSKEATQLAGNQ